MLIMIPPKSVALADTIASPLSRVHDDDYALLSKRRPPKCSRMGLIIIIFSRRQREDARDEDRDLRVQPQCTAPARHCRCRRRARIRRVVARRARRAAVRLHERAPHASRGRGRQRALRDDRRARYGVAGSVGVPRCRRRRDDAPPARDRHLHRPAAASARDRARGRDRARRLRRLASCLASAPDGCGKSSARSESRSRNGRLVSTRPSRSSAARGRAGPSPIREPPFSSSRCRSRRARSRSRSCWVATRSARCAGPRPSATVGSARDFLRSTKP